MQLEVVVVVIAHNSADVIEGLLDSVPPALEGHRYRVVVVDNASTDGIHDIVRRYPSVELVERPNLGYSAGINTGAARAPEAEAILVLNPDVRLFPGSVSKMLWCLRRTGAGVVAPRTLGGHGELAWTLRREPSLLRASGMSFTGGALFSEYVQEAEEYATPHVVSWAVGAALLVDGRCHAEVGGWDESYFLYSEETDFCLRAADKGWLTYYDPTATVTHFGGASGRSGHTHSMQILNRVRLYARRHGPVAAWTYYGLTVLSEASWVIRGNEKTKSSLRALVRPRVRPAELGLGASLLPR